MKSAYLIICSLCLPVLDLAQLPASTPYPYAPPGAVLAEAQEISDSLEAYIQAWTQGLVSNQIPDHLIPEGITDSKDFYLANPDSVTAEETWAVRYSKPINLDSLLGGIPDPNFTYLFLGTAFAPFGSKLIIEGEFPHARFFSIQVCPPLNGEQYYAGREFGTAEVSLVDVDIDPLPGHTNPYRVGANRNATNRSYRVEIDLTIGDPVSLNGAAHVFPYRDNSNTRKGALLAYQGPLGQQTILGTPNPEPGDWNLGCLWIRIYRPDLNTDALGGVPMPKVYYELPTGDQYFIGSDFSKLLDRVNATAPNRNTISTDNPNYGSHVGWNKSWGITRNILNGVCFANDWTFLKDSIRAIELGWTGRGEFQNPPANMEPHATINNYCTYLGRAINVPPGRVAVLTGKLPTFPDTKNGEPVMQDGQVRYFSLTGIDADPFSGFPSSAVHAISDDEMIVDADNNYIIVYSRESDRPINAYPSDNVSWVNWGTQSELGVIARWVCVSPDWTFPMAPQENNLTYLNSDWASPQFDSALIGVNWQKGFMGCYQPKVHYMAVEQFEALGSNLQSNQVPVWVDDNYSIGPTASQFGSVAAASVLDASTDSEPSNAIDGNLATAWASGLGNPATSITIDLDSVQQISAIKLQWDLIFFGKDYNIETSSDGVVWEAIISVSDENGSTDVYDHLVGVQGRYVRLNLTQFNLVFYRLIEFEVYTLGSPCDLGVTVNTLENQLDEEPDLFIFPNPSSDIFTIQVKGLKSTYTLFTLSGKQLLQGTFPGEQFELDLSQFPNGVYLLTVQVGEEQVTQKIIKQ
ncbi:MAG: discoidin domain-containing protein [Bacteroidota bacterium]